MKRLSNYNTKQYEMILSYIAALDGEHITAAKIVDHFGNSEIPLGRTTVYRHLDKLTESGKLRRYNIDNISGACYQYINHDEQCVNHIHLKCDKCGVLLHLHCDMLTEIQEHFITKHDFHVNAMKMVLYGLCGSCNSDPNQ